jgi:hypothetical protein
VANMSAIFPSTRSGTRIGTAEGWEGDSFAYGRAGVADRADSNGLLPLDPRSSGAGPVSSRWIAVLKLIGLMTTLIAAAGVAVSIVVRLALWGFGSAPVR